MQEWPQVGLELWAAAANVYGSYTLQTEVLLNSATAVLKLHLVMSYSESSRRYTHKEVIEGVSEVTRVTWLGVGTVIVIVNGVTPF